MLHGSFNVRTGVFSVDGASFCHRGALNVYYSGVLLNRKELAVGTESDAEIVARLYDAKGIAAFEQLNGPFVLALFDGKQLVVARDQVGQGFLFFRREGDIVRFSEELRELNDGCERDWQAFADYLSLGYIPAPRTAWKGVSKLRAGTVVVIKDSQQSEQTYWSPSFDGDVANLSFEEACEEAKKLILQAIQRCVAIDADLGVLLSGGIDSTLMLELTSEATPRAPKAFTVGFSHPRYDERALASLVAGTVGAEHITEQVEASAYQECAKIQLAAGEPFADSSLLPDICAMKLASQHCKTVLMGDGGDEFFGGYRRYRLMAMRATMGEGLSRLEGGVASALAKLLPNASEGRTSLSSFTRVAKAFSLPPVPCYASFQEIFSPDDVKQLAPELASQTESYYVRWQEIYNRCGGVKGVNLIDLLTYLPDDGCRKEGLAASAAGMTAFSPLLDMDVVRFALKLPLDYKLNLRQGKLILRKLGEKKLPSEIYSQAKRGFGMPVAAWLRNELKDVVQELPKRLQSFGFFEQKALEVLVSEHLSEKSDHGAKLWALLAMCGY